MQFHRDISDNVNIIRAHGSDGIRIDDKLFSLPCVVAISTIIENWITVGIDGLDADMLKPVIDLEPELIILGSGPVLKFPSAKIGATVNQLGIGFEVMDTAAGCRTYNLLAHEGRNVALALVE